jgi:choline dehydrogenase-like flavoprotein
VLKSLEAVAPDAPQEAEVIVVGAGLAGLFLANSLAAQGLRVIVLESGDAEQKAETHPLNATEMTRAYYQGADFGRFRCLGGTSTRWGGALLPYLPEDMAAHPCGWHEGWGIDPAAMAAALGEAEAVFGVQPGGYEAAPDQADPALLPGFLARRPKWPRFRNRNTANLFAEQIRLDARLQIWTGATVTRIDLAGGRIGGVTAMSRANHSLTARAPTVVIAAGAIETTRLLLLMDRAGQGRVFPAGSPLGRGFHDHVSAPIADLEDFDRSQIARMFGFQFVAGGGMRNLRFELAPQVRSEAGLPAAFLHVAFSRDPDSGFEGLRGLFQAAQRRQLPQAADFRRIIADLPWFARAVWWRGVERRVYPPSRSGFELHLVTEQAPDPEHVVDLSSDRQDAFGLPLARISWCVTPSDIAGFKAVADLAMVRWQRGSIGTKARLVARTDAEIEAALQASGGIYHPAGTTRIGATATTGVVDSDLNVHGVPGLRLLSTSVFPAIGGSSPSLALVQLALRMSKDIVAARVQKP